MNAKIDPSMLSTQARVDAVQGQAKNRSQDNEELRKLSRDFEAVFVQTLFKEMRATVPEGGLLKRGMAETAFVEMLDAEVAKSAVQRQGYGIADALYRQLLGDLGPGSPVSEAAGQGGEKKSSEGQDEKIISKLSDQDGR